MINSIVKAISIALNTEFGNAYKIYAEEVKQGLKEPCFFVFCINPTNELFLGKRYFRANQFCIQYFPSTNKKKEESNAVADRLYLCLELIAVDGDLVRAAKMHYEMVDGVLNFFLNYDLFVYRKEQTDPMETIETDTTVKG